MNCKNWDRGKSKGRARWWDKGNRRDREKVKMLFPEV